MTKIKGYNPTVAIVDELDEAAGRAGAALRLLDGPIVDDTEAARAAARLFSRTQEEQEATAARIIGRRVLDKVAALVAFDTIKAALFPSLRAQYLFSGSTAAYTAARRRFVGSTYDDQTGRRKNA